MKLAHSTMPSDVRSMNAAIKMTPRPKADQIVDPAVISAACVQSSGELFSRSQKPPFDAVALLEGGSGKLGIGGREVTFVGDLLIFLRGQISRAYWSSEGKPLKLWYISFKASPLFYEGVPHLNQTDPLKLVWPLTVEQEGAFKAFFVKIVAEYAIQRPSNRIAQSAWLRLLLVAMERWATLKTFSISPPEAAGSDVLELWEKINSSLENPDLVKTQMSQLFPNYNSLRHRFKKTFGASPKQMIMALRINQAKALLLESSLGLKEIASKLGYYRHHEFTRAFRKFVGVSPSRWRANPTAE